MPKASIFSTAAGQAILPDNALRIRAITPEQHLALGVLSRAIIDASGNCGLDSSKTPKQIVRDAKRFLFTKPPYEYAFSFLWICEVLDLEAPTIRKRVKALISQGPLSNTRHTMRQANECA